MQISVLTGDNGKKGSQSYLKNTNQALKLIKMYLYDLWIIVTNNW